MIDINRAWELAGHAIKALTHPDLVNKPEIISVHVDPEGVLIDIEGDDIEAKCALIELALRPSSQEEFKGAALAMYGYGNADPSGQEMRVEVRAYRTKGRGANLRSRLSDLIGARS